MGTKFVFPWPQITSNKDEKNRLLSCLRSSDFGLLVMVRTWRTSTHFIEANVPRTTSSQFDCFYLQLGGIFSWRGSVVTQHLQRDALFGHGHNGFLVPDELSHNGYVTIKSDTPHNRKNRKGEIKQKRERRKPNYMLVLLMPMPQKMEKASTKFSSFLVKGKLLNLLTNCGRKVRLRF